MRFQLVLDQYPGYFFSVDEDVIGPFDLYFLPGKVFGQYFLDGEGHDLVEEKGAGREHKGRIKDNRKGEIGICLTHPMVFELSSPLTLKVGQDGCSLGGFAGKKVVGE